MKIAAHGPDLASLQELVDSLPMFIFTNRPDGYLDYCNQRMLEYLGVPFEALEGWKWGAVVHPDDVAEVTARWRASLASGEPFECEARVRRADGAYRWMLHREVPVRDESGQIVRWYGSGVDIDDRKQAEFYLAEGQRLAHTGSWAFNAAGFDYWSPELFAIHGLAPGGQAPTVAEYMELVHPEDRGFVAQEIQRMLSDHRGFDFTKRIVRPDGSIRHVRCVGTAATSGGIFQGFVGTGIDVTEHEELTKALRKSEAYLAEAQRLSGTGSFGWRPDSGEIVWSAETYRIFGYDEEITPTLDSLVRRVHPEDRAEFKRVIDTASGSAAAQFEQTYRLLLPDESVKHVHALARPMADAFENHEFVGAITDVTEHTLAEGALRESERKFRLVVESIAGLVATLTPGGDVDFVNGQVLEYFGKTFEELKNWQTTDAIHPDDLDRVLAVFANTIPRGLPYDVEHRLRRSDGVYRWFHARGRPLRDAEGAIARWYVLLTDIDERKQAEQRLKEQEAELRQILDLSPQLVGVLGPARERLHLNHTALEYLGVGLDEWRQRGPGLSIHPEDVDRLYAYADRASATGVPYEVEARVRKYDGSYRWFQFRFNPVRDEQGQITRWYWACTDIEDRKRAHERLEQENVALREEVDKASMFEEIVGNSLPLRSVLSYVSRVAPTDSTVLITGETGTGKELVARAIHKRSTRSARVFVSVNCAAIPAALVASELFGHEKGAFTGALQRRIGRFELAEGGTIFLDEIGELPPETQIALLRVLQEREFERVGGSRPIAANVRVIAATNRDLLAAVAEKTFRQDLFYRLNVFPLEVPPLRDRRSDIPMLVEYFTHRFASRTGKRIRTVAGTTLQMLQGHHWPGNIRELQNIVERAVIVCDSDTLAVDERWLSERPDIVAVPQPSRRVEGAAGEKEAIEVALREAKGRVAGPFGAAARLGVPSTTLESRIKTLHIDKRRFKSS